MGSGWAPAPGYYDEAGGRIGVPTGVAGGGVGVEQPQPGLGLGFGPDGMPLDIGTGDIPSGVVSAAGRGDITPEAAEQLMGLYFELLGTITEGVLIGFDPQAEAARYIEAARKGNLAEAINGMQGLIGQAQQAADRHATETERQRNAREDEANRVLRGREIDITQGGLDVSRGYLAQGAGQLELNRQNQQLAEQQAAQSVANELQRREETMVSGLGQLAGQRSGAIQQFLGNLPELAAFSPPPGVGATSGASQVYADLASRVGGTPAPPMAYGGPMSIPPFLLPFEGLEAEIRALAG